MKKENKNQIDRKLLKPWSRLACFLIDFVMVFLLGVMFDRIMVTPIAKNVTPLNELNETYNSEVLEYQNKQNEYNLYYYKDGERIKNENVTKEETDAFMADERVIQIRKELPEVQDTLQAIRLTVLGIDAFIASLLYFTFSFIIFGKGRSISLLIFKSRMTDFNGNKITISKSILYGFLRWVFLFPLGIITILILPIYMMYELFYKDNQTFLERKLQIECRIDPKDI